MASKTLKLVKPAADVARFKFRIVVRGNKDKVDGPRVRRVKNIDAVDVSHANMLAGPIAEEIVNREKLHSPSFNVYPPIGERCDGTASKGYMIKEGLVHKMA